MSHERTRLIVEVAVSVVLLVVIALRTFSYPFFPDNSLDIDADDGYPYYARHLDESGTIMPEYRRLPGYPAFLVLAARLTGQYYSKAGSLLQGALSLILIVAALFPLRRKFGSSFTLILLAMLAAPNFWVRLSVFAFPDYLSAVLSCVFALVAFRWLELEARRAQIAHAVGLVLITAAAILLKTGVTILIAIFAVSMLVARIVTGEPRTVSIGRLALSATCLSAGAFVLQSVILAACGSGSVTFYRNAMHGRIVTYLPPAADTEAEREIERAKAEIATREGERLEDKNFRNSLWIVQSSVEDVWWDRLRAHPLQYLGVMLDEVRRKHYFVALSFVPFMADTTPHRADIPRNDGSPASDLYRATGVYLPEYGHGLRAAAGAVGEAMFRMLLLWGTVIGGFVLMLPRAPFVTVTLALIFVVYVGALAFGLFIDSRYLLPFAPAISVLQALALATLLGRGAGDAQVSN